MKTKKSCIIYCKQASNKQNNNSINRQELILKGIAEKRRFKIKKIIKDIGTTTEIKKLIEWIKENKTDYLLVMGIDRLCRRQTDFNQILDLIKKKNLKGIITQKEEFDGKDDTYSILILGMFCDLEKEILSKRIKKGLQNKRSK